MVSSKITDLYIVQKFGYYLPFIMAGGAFNSIGSGLLTLISPSTTLAQLTGFQLLSGTGRGLSLPMVCMLSFCIKPQI